MAETLSMDAIRNYLIKVGCKIEYPILVNAFKQHLYNPDAQLQGKIRTQFKDYVNRLATVSLENNMKFINLRPEFRPGDFVDGGGMNGQIPPSYQTPPQPPINCKVRIEQTPQQLPPQQNHQQLSQPMPIQVPISQPRTQQPMLPPQRPPPNNPSVLQPRLQNSLDATTTTSSQPQSPKQLFQNHALTRASAESLQEPSSQLSSHASHQISVQLRHPQQQQQQQQQQPQQQHHRSDSLDTGTRSSMIMPPPPPRPPPRRRQSSASLFKPSPSKQQPIEKSREIHDLAKRGLGRVREHALKLNSSASSSDLNALMPLRNSNNSTKENRLSRDLGNLGNLSSALQRNGSHLTNRSRSSHREDESDSSSLQPTDPLRRKWAVESSNCNYNGLIALLKEDPKLATHKDIINGYTALHWAAKFGNLDIIKLIAGTHNVSADIKSSAGYTPLHIAYMFDRPEAAELLLKSYNANANIRDHSGKRPRQYAQQQQR